MNVDLVVMVKKTTLVRGKIIVVSVVIMLNASGIGECE